MLAAARQWDSTEDTVAQAEAIGPRLWTESTEGTRDFADLLLRERGNLLANRETGFFLRGQQ